MRRQEFCDSQGATLTEVLIVIALITTLTSLIIPAITNAKIVVERCQCVHNLRQWGVATHLFAHDNEDFLPKDGAPNGSSRKAGWYVDLPRTLGLQPYYLAPWRTNPLAPCKTSLWICPGNPRRSNGKNLFHYCLNQHINGAGTGNQIRLSTFSKPHELVWLFDNGGLAAVAQQNNVHTNLHPNGANFLFLDSHVSYHRRETYWDDRRNRGLTEPTGLVWRPE